MSWTLFPGNFSCYRNDTTECQAGTYSTSGSRVCRPCPKGAQCPNNGLSTFFICANGTYSDVEGLSDCKQCDAGFRCPNAGLEAKEECPNGTYSNSTGSLFCILCPEGHRWDVEVTVFANFTSIRCCICSYVLAGMAQFNCTGIHWECVAENWFFTCITSVNFCRKKKIKLGEFRSNFLCTVQ